MLRLLLLLVFCPAVLNAQSWVSCSPVPSGGRDDAAAFSLNGYGYLVTGNLGGFTESNRLWQYDPSNDQWTEKTAFPGIPRQYAGCFAIDENAYIIGGISESSVPLNDVWKYNAATDQWSQLNDFPGEARWSMFAASVQNSGFLGTGTTLSALLDDCWSYDPFTDHWSPIPDFPGGISRETVVFVIGERVFTGLGYAEGYIPSDKWFSYSTLSGEWSAAADFPGGARSYAIAGAAGSFAYAGTGYDSLNQFLGDMYRFNPESSTWEAMESFVQSEGIRGMSAFTIDETPYFVTGLSDINGRTSQMWKLVNEKDTEIEVKCYPNPAKGAFIVKAEKGSQLKIFTPEGRLAREMTTEDETTFLEMNNKGMYLLEVLKNKERSVIRLLIE